MGSDEHQSAYDVLKRIEDHCGKKVEGRRLRLHIASEIDRQMNARRSLERRIKAVLDGEETYDPGQKKAIYLPESQRSRA